MELENANNRKEPSKFFFLSTKPDQQKVQSEIMQKAFVSMKKRKYSPKWIDFENLKSTNLQPHDLVVVDQFEGGEFEYFRDVKVRIIGPLVIKYCDEDTCRNPFSQIPMRTWPIYSQCMRGLEVTCTNLPAEKKKEIQNKIELMSGKYYHNLHASTSFLVSDSVLTSKSRGAGRYKIPIMTEDWVETCWKQYQYECRRANEESIISRHRLPILYGMNVVVSGLSTTERDQIKQIVETNGGSYHPALKLKPILPNMILILREKQGDKYTHAKQREIPCLRVEWIYDSIKARYALPFEVYNIDAEEKKNEENKSPNLPLPPPSKIESSSGVDLKANHKSLESLASTIKAIAPKVGEENNTFLDGHNIHAIGFDKAMLELIKNSARFCGAFYYINLNESVTDVIVGSEILNDGGEISFKNLWEKYGDRLVNIDWFIDCLRLSKLCPHLPYRVYSLAQLKVSTPTTTISNIDNGLKNINFCGTNATSSLISSLTTTVASPKKSSPIKRFNVLEDDPDEVRKMVQLNLPSNVKLKDIHDRIHPSQNCKPLIQDDDEDSPPVVWSPREDFDHVDISLDCLISEPMPKLDNNVIGKFNKRTHSDEDFTSIKKVRSVESCSTFGVLSNGRNDYDDDHMSDNNDKVHDEKINVDEEDEELSSIDVEDLMTTIDYESSHTPIMLMFSGFEQELKMKLIEACQDKLKVSVRDDSLVSRQVTHLILKHPCATEKVMASIAAGVYIMKPEFIVDSLKAGKLLPESEYQWGMDYHEDDTPNKKYNSMRLMSSAIKWKHHLDQTKRKLFEDYKFLFLNQMNDNIILIACSNIIRAGAAEVFILDDFYQREAELNSLLPKITYALVYSRNFKQKPLFPKQKFLQYIDYFDRNNCLMDDRIISRLILDGPETSIDELRKKYPISIDIIRNSLSKFY